MQKGDDYRGGMTTDEPLGELDKERNRPISKLRSQDERHIVIMKEVLK